MARLDVFAFHHQQTQSLKLLVYRIISPTAIFIILLLSWADYRQQKSLTPFDIGIRAFFLAAYMIISILLWVKKEKLPLFEKLFYFSVLIGYVSIYYSSLYALYQGHITVNHIAGLFWVPILYFMAYLVFELHTSFRINLALQGIFLIPTVLYLFLDSGSEFMMAIWSFHFSNVAFVLSLGVIMNTMMRYVSGQSRAEVLEEAANIDFLTQINNRRSFDLILRNIMDSQTVLSHSFSVIMIDLDHFKKLNDTHGHLAGDQVLRSFAACLKKAIRDGDHLGRWGGEEFILLLPETNLNIASQVAERIRNLVHEQMFSGFSITASFGIAESRIGETPESLINRADQALYKAKELGRDRVEVYTP